MHHERPFAIAHHVTFVSFRVPIWLKDLNIPVVFGPVGGADKAPVQLLSKGFGPKLWCKEVLRNVLTEVGMGLMQLFPPISGSLGCCLAATPSMGTLFERAGFQFEVFPAVGIDPGPIRESSLGNDSGMRFLFEESLQYPLFVGVEGVAPNAVAALAGGTGIAAGREGGWG